MKTVMIALLALGTAGAAQADIIPTLTVSSPVQVGSLFAYSYTATLAADQALRTNNFFTIYDFEGFDSFGSVPAGFTGSASLLGRTPGDVLPFDSADVLNVTFTYNGATINQPIGGMQGVSTELGTFTVFSKFDGLGPIPFTSRSIKNNGGAAGSTVSNIGTTFGPLAGGGIGADVPEPSVWAMLLIGFGAIGVSARRRRPVAIAA